MIPTTPRGAAREAIQVLKGDLDPSAISDEARALYDTLSLDELEKMARGDDEALNRGSRPGTDRLSPWPENGTEEGACD